MERQSSMIWGRHGSNHVNHVEGQHDPRSRRQTVFWWWGEQQTLERWIDGRRRDGESKERRWLPGRAMVAREGQRTAQSSNINRNYEDEVSACRAATARGTESNLP